MAATLLLALAIGPEPARRPDAVARALHQLQHEPVHRSDLLQPGYAQYGLPGVGVSPWNPIIQAQFNLGMRTARYNMYSAWADQSNAAANLYYQQAVNQQIQNARMQAPIQSRYDVETRAPRPVAQANPKAAKLLPKSDVLKEDGEVIWPEILLEQSTRQGAEPAPRRRSGLLSRNSRPAERRRLPAWRKPRASFSPTANPRSSNWCDANRGRGQRSCSSFWPAWSRCSTAWPESETLIGIR